MTNEPTPEQVRGVAEYELSEMLAVVMTVGDECDVHGEECPVPNGGTCCHYRETYRLATDADARQAGRWAFIVGRVYEVAGNLITFWPFAERVPVRS